MCRLEVSNEYKSLTEKLQILKEQLSEKILEKDNLLLIECRNLNVKYMTTIGVYEYKLYELYCSIMRIRRKIEIIQAFLNRDEVVFIEDVEKQLDKEYKEYREKLEKMFDEMKQADELSKCRVLSPKEEKEFKKLYRQIVKKLHPDLNPDITEQQLEMFNRAVQAYNDGDLNALRMISVLCDSEVDSTMDTNGIEQIKEQIDHVKQQIEYFNEEISRIKNTFPYTEKELLFDDYETEKKIDELKLQIEEFKEIFRKYDERLKKVLGDKNVGDNQLNRQ